MELSEVSRFEIFRSAQNDKVVTLNGVKRLNYFAFFVPNIVGEDKLFLMLNGVKYPVTLSAEGGEAPNFVRDKHLNHFVSFV
ncbi:MAG: hypothetical protein OHK0036_13840 [Bacteroidia bacterium]